MICITHGRDLNLVSVLIKQFKDLFKRKEPVLGSKRWRRKTMRMLRKKYPRGTEMRGLKILFEFQFMRQKIKEDALANLYKNKTT